MNEVRDGVGGMKVGKGKFTSYRLAQRSEKPWVDHFHSASPPPQFSRVRFEEARGSEHGSGRLSETTQPLACLWPGGKQ